MKKLKQEAGQKRRLETVLWCVLLAALVLWSLPLAGKGIDVRDTGSYLTKYRYIFDSSVKVNELHYFLGEVAGGILYALTPVRKVLALNVASSLVYVAAALLLCAALKDFLPKVPLLACALTGSFFGITWIRTLNWNAWTALLLAAGLLCLLKGLKRTREYRECCAKGAATDAGNRTGQGYLLASGFLLALNTYFRMPNMLFLALIAVVFWNEMLVILEEEKGSWRRLFCWKHLLRAIRSCRWFFAGAVLGAAAGLLLALLVLGPDTVLSNLSVLTSVGAGENEENTHSITTGIYLFLLGMRDGAKAWVLYGIGLALLWAAACGVGRAFFGRLTAEDTQAGTGAVQGGTYGRKWLAGLAAAAAGIAAAVLALRGDILTAHEWTAFGALFWGILGAFRYAKKDRALSCLCAAAVIIEGFLTIGTDTGVNYYRVFMGLPLALLLILAGRDAKELREQGRKGLAGLIGLFAVFTFVFVTAAGIRYAATHVYHDAPNAELTAEINHPMYGGIYTSEERAASLNRLMEELAPYKHCRLLQIGCFNIGCVLTDMKPFYDSSWPDLEYLPMETFEGELSEALTDKDAPVLLLGTAEESGMNWSPKKYAMIRELGESSRYRTLYTDELYTIYVPVE